jgi:photosystem I subunit 10
MLRGFKALSQPKTGDPASFTLADTLACGSLGHIIGVGVVLGLKNIGAL